MLSVDISSGVAIVAIAGRLDGLTTPRIEPALTEVLASGRNVVIDLAGLTYVASVGLRLLLLAAKRVAQAGHTLAVCTLQPSVQEVFEVAGLDMLMTICATRQEALASVRSG